MGRSNGHHPPPVRNPGPPPHDAGAQVIGGADYQRLWRLAHAAELLGKLPSEAAKMLGIEADHTSAIAHHIAEDLTAILNRSTPADE